MATWYLGIDLGQQKDDVQSSLASAPGTNVVVEIDLSKVDETTQIYMALQNIFGKILDLWKPN